jgi:hypothetical protein
MSFNCNYLIFKICFTKIDFYRPAKNSLLVTEQPHVHSCLLYIFLLKTPLYRVETLTGIKFITWKQRIFVKNPETGRFLFFLLHILVHMVFAYLFREVRNHPQLFFSNVRVYQVTPRLKGQFVRNTTHYLFLEYFQSLRAKK